MTACCEKASDLERRWQQASHDGEYDAAHAFFNLLRGHVDRCYKALRMRGETPAHERIERQSRRQRTVAGAKQAKEAMRTQGRWSIDRTRAYKESMPPCWGCGATEHHGHGLCRGCYRRVIYVPVRERR